MSQIDLVPTLSLLLGVPIPYSNLGSVITEVMYDHNSKAADNQLLQALKINQQQITNYLTHYNLVLFIWSCCYLPLSVRGQLFSIFGVTNKIN